MKKIIYSFLFTIEKYPKFRDKKLSKFFLSIQIFMLTSNLNVTSFRHVFENCISVGFDVILLYSFLCLDICIYIC